jgi:hypothetical protein
VGEGQPDVIVIGIVVVSLIPGDDVPERNARLQP